MRRDHQLTRRLFLSELGKGTLAVAVFGGGLAACSSDSGSDTGSDSTAGSGEDSASTTNPGSTTLDGEATSDDESVRWERVDFGFVSAYVLARGREIAIVDTGTAGNSNQIEAALTALSVGWDDVNHVIVTHAHGDHVGGLDEVLTAAGAATGYAGAGDVEKLTAPRDLVSVTDGDEIFGLNIIGTPGHTAGHISVLDPETGLFVAGDAMVTEGGRLAGPAEQFSDDIDLARESVKGLTDEMIETILVGHGDPVLDGAGAQLSELAASF